MGHARHETKPKHSPRLGSQLPVKNGQKGGQAQGKNQRMRNPPMAPLQPIRDAKFEANDINVRKYRTNAASTNSLKLTVSPLKLAYKTAGTAILENADAIVDLDKFLLGSDYQPILEPLPYR